MNSDYIGKNVLITTEAWFYAPDGKTYRAVWGTLKAIKRAEDTLGIRPNGRSANWYVEIGNVSIAGCQINYAVQTDVVNFGEADETNLHDGRYVVSARPSSIYNANKESQ